MLEVTGVVLCGGRSIRMGQDKAQLRYAGNTWLQYAQKRLQQLPLEHIYVADAQHDIYPNQGPLSGIHAAFSCYQQDLLITPVDMPLLTANLLNALLQHADGNDYVHYANFHMPLYLRFSSSIMSYLETVLQTKNADRSVKSMLRQLHGQQLRCDQSSVFMNINTVQQLQQLQASMDLPL